MSFSWFVLLPWEGLKTQDDVFWTIGTVNEMMFTYLRWKFISRI